MACVLDCLKKTLNLFQIPVQKRDADIPLGRSLTSASVSVRWKMSKIKYQVMYLGLEYLVEGKDQANSGLPKQICKMMKKSFRKGEIG